MARIAFILLCHKDPKAIIEQARQLTAVGDYVAIHFDARAAQDDFQMIRDALADNANVAIVTRRVKCGWGQWSLVQATLCAVEKAADSFPRASHFYMVSGDCRAIKSAAYAHDFLDGDDCDYIEHNDFFESDWIKTGMKEDRLIYRHRFNERTQSRLFYGSYRLQKRYGLKRRIPPDLQIMIGSQWWCLRRQTIEAILQFCKDRRDVMRFFRLTWIPDETFFQTLVCHLVPRNELRNRTLTFLMFTDYGMPVTFYNDHYDLLLGQDSLFARKISSEADDLKKRLGDLYTSDQVDFSITNEGRSLFQFMVGRGRVGQRFGPRIWQAAASLGHDRTVLIVVCKKWHVAKRLIEAVKTHTDTPAIAYLFDEEDTPLPDLGGIENSLDKRSQHKRAVMQMLFDAHGTDSLLICVDPARVDVIADFYADRAQVRLLHVDCDLSDDYLQGHAKRIGLASDHTSDAMMAQIVPTVRQDVQSEATHLRDQGYAHFYRLREQGGDDENAIALADFLEIPFDVALKIAQTNHLFSD